MDALHKDLDFPPSYIARENMMKKPFGLASHQDVHFPSDNSEHDRHFGHHRENATAFSRPNARTNFEDVEDTSLDNYIPCFVKKIKGMKPFLIDIKPATTFRKYRGNISDCYDRQYSSKKNEGTSRNLSDPYSTAAAHDFGSSSNCTSWSSDPRNERTFAAPCQAGQIPPLSNQPACSPYISAPRQAGQIPPLSNQPACSPYTGNRETTSNMSSYVSAHNHRRAENFIRSTLTTYQANRPTRNYRNTHQPGRKQDEPARGPRIGRGKCADLDDYNRKDFSVNYSKAKFFMIKSFTENDLYNCMKYNVWSSTSHGNQKLDLVYREAQKIQEVEGERCPIFLFFSVNSSGQFVGLAEMLGPVDFKKNMDFWLQDRWNGFFPVKWHIVKDIPNYNFRDITLENNDNKVVTFSRDTQEIGLPQGLKMLRIFKEYEPESSLLDDFEYYEEKQRQKLAKKNCAMQCSDDYLVEEFGNLRFSSEGRF